MIGVLSKTEPEKEINVAHQLCNAFDASRKDEMTQTTNHLQNENDKQYEVPKPLWIFTIYWLIYRNLLIVMRDPSIQKLRIVQKIVIISFKCNLQMVYIFYGNFIYRQLQ